jgi:hypothetical protein
VTTNGTLQLADKHIADAMSQMDAAHDALQGDSDLLRSMAHSAMAQGHAQIAAALVSQARAEAVLAEPNTGPPAAVWVDDARLSPEGNAEMRKLSPE